MSNLTFGQAKHTLEIFAQQNLTTEDMRLLHSGLLSDFLEGISLSRGIFPSKRCLSTRDELRVFLGLLPLEPTLVVDYDQPIQKMIDAGRYDRVIDNLGNAAKYTNTRAGRGVKKINIRLQRLIESVDLEKNEADKKLGGHYRLASYEEVFAFGATYPKVQQRCSYGIFGRSYSSAKDSRGFQERFHPNLWGGTDARGLSMEAGGVYSNPGTHFLFVEK